MKSSMEHPIATMLTIRLLSAAATLVLIASAIAVAADPAPVARSVSDSNRPGATAPVRKTASEMIRMISFKLKDGRAVSGKIVSDDRSQVTIAETTGGKIVPVSYSRLDMEPRSISYQSASEYQYWMTTGQYFESHTWDWQDDADEFAQALRCYEAARDLAAQAMGKDSAAAQDADARVNRVLDSRQKWIDTAKPRAQMAELELKSTLAQRLDTMSKAIQALQTSVDNLNQSRTAYEASLTAYQRDVNARVDQLAQEVRQYYDTIRNSVYNQQGVGVYPSTPTTMPAK
jgi:hypothetical protein